MEISRELLFFFSALGAFNGFLLSFYFFFWVKPKSLSNKFLGVFLFMLSIRVAKSVFYFFNPELPYSFLQLGLTGCFFIGPFLYFYVASVTNQNGKSSLRWKEHLYILVPIIVLVNILVPFETNIELWRTYVIRCIYDVWLIYSFLALYKLRGVLQKIVSKGEKVDRFDFWVLSIWVGNILILAAYLFCGITSYILGALLFSFLFYILLILLFFRFQKEPYNIAIKQKYGRKKIENAPELITRLNEIMENEKLYKNPLLKLQGLASKLNVLPHTLSQLLNENLEKGFSQYLNEYRIKEACEIIKEGSDLTFEAIAYDVGYNSKSTFYTAFKKITGTTPAKFKSENRV
ncbi:MAG: helix-turn-helix domain-containing protein [Bacteroidia bacterium]